MKRNMDATYGLIYNQRVLLKLIDHGMTREEAYDLVQPKQLTHGIIKRRSVRC